MFKNPFSFNGRIRRTEFGITAIIYLVCYLFILAALQSSGGILNMIAFISIIPVIWFLWAQGAKRCHDVGNSGLWQIIPFYVLWLLFQDGQSYPNQYGNDPKGRGADYPPYHPPFPPQNNYQAPPQYDSSVPPPGYHPPVPPSAGASQANSNNEQPSQ